MTRIVTDFIVVGSGIAGLTTALSLANSGEVIILTKAQEDASNSFRAQGGIAAAIGKDDSPELHREDTLRTGADLCNPDSVDLMVKMAPDTIRLLAKWGTPFDQKNGYFALAKEGAHSVSRILHVRGDSTGAGITSSLLNQVEKTDSVVLKTHTLVKDLIVYENVCRGVVTVDQTGEVTIYLAKKGVVLATGGCGQLFRYTTNDLVSTGDGIAMAHRAKVRLMDMEFVQFHPTALAVEQNPMFLISEAVRGEGAILRNQDGEPFMEKVHKWRDLAPRDVVSRAIYQEMKRGNRVYLDATSLGSRFKERFPKIYRECLKHNIDPQKDWIPVTPAAHFLMGGICTDLYGETSLPRLFACGEVACTGVHGANRLASNSLLEGAVFAQRVAKKLSEYEDLPTSDTPPIIYEALCINKQSDEVWRRRIQEIMWECCGIVRSSEGLLKGLSQIEQLQKNLPLGMFECENMLTVAHIMLKSALWRKESRGGHYRCDYPKTIPGWSQKHNVI